MLSRIRVHALRRQHQKCCYLTASSQGRPHPCPGGPERARLVKRSGEALGIQETKPCVEVRVKGTRHVIIPDEGRGVTAHVRRSKLMLAKRSRWHGAEECKKAEALTAGLGRVLGLGGRRIVGHGINSPAAALAVVGCLASGARRETRMQQSTAMHVQAGAWSVAVVCVLWDVGEKWSCCGSTKSRPDHMQILLCSEALLVSTKLPCKSAGSAVAHDLLVFPFDYCKLPPGLSIQPRRPL